MPMTQGPRDLTIYSYNDEAHGQIAVGTVASPWFRTEGISELLVMGVFAGGTTQVIVDQGDDGATSEISSVDLFSGLSAGTKVNIAFRWARVRIVQATATTTNAELAVRASD